MFGLVAGRRAPMVECTTPRPGADTMNRFAFAGALCALAACSGDRSPDFVTRSDDLSAAKVVDVSRDQTSQNETPLAINPTDPNNLITGANDWNHNDGCAVNASFDGGKTWTPTLPSGFVPGLTKYTNDPSVPGTGIYDAAGDPYVAFGPDGTAYFACQAFNFTPPFEIALYVSRSSNGGRTWQTGLPGDRPTQVSVWNGNGKSKGSNGQFPDHESMFIDVSAKSPYQGSIYIAWVQFNGNSSHSPVNIAVSRDGAATFSTPAHRGRARRDAVPYVRQRSAGRQGQRHVREHVGGWGRQLEHAPAARHVREPGLHVPAVLLQPFRRSVPLGRVVSGAGLRSGARPP